MSGATVPGAAPVVVPTVKPTAAAPVQTSAVPDTAAELAKLGEARKAIELKERSHVVNVRKFSEEKKTLGQKLSAYEQYEKEKLHAKANPSAFFQKVLGDDWYNIMVEAKVNGVPPAQLVADEIAKVEERVTKRFEDRDAEAKKTASESARQADQAARQQLHAEGLSFLEASGKDYPIFKKLGDGPRVASILAHRIESEYKRTERRDSATGQLLQPGRILTTKEAADLLESEVLALVEEAAAHEKYQPKLREKLQPSKQPPPAPGGQNQQRRTLSNDLTGSTPGRTPAVTDAERRERAINARNAHVASRAPKS